MSHANSRFKFEIDQDVEIAVSGERGTIRARAEFAEAAPSYFLRYQSRDGAAREAWWNEPALFAVPAAAVQPDEAPAKKTVAEVDALVAELNKEYEDVCAARQRYVLNLSEFQKYYARKPAEARDDSSSDGRGTPTGSIPPAADRPQIGEEATDVFVRFPQCALGHSVRNFKTSGETVDLFKGRSLDAIEKALIDFIAAHYREDHEAISPLVKRADQKSDGFFVILSAHTISLLAQARAREILLPLKREFAAKIAGGE